MGHVRTQVFRKCQRQVIPPVSRWFKCPQYILEVSAVHDATTFLRYEWLENSTLQKVAETTYTSCFTMTLMSFVHAASLSLVRRPTSILCYEWRTDSTFQKVPKTSNISRFTMILMSPVHSASLSLLRRPISILRYEWRENLTFQKLPETTHTSCFTLILVSPVSSLVNDKIYAFFFFFSKWQDLRIFFSSNSLLNLNWKNPSQIPSFAKIFC